MSAVMFDREWRARCSVQAVSKAQVSWMVMRHYLQKYPAIIVCTLGMFHDQELCGMVIFAEAPRETSIRYACKTWELARLWVDDGIPRNAESWLIAQAVRYVRVHHLDVDALVSYADPAYGHTGAIYRAANWEPDGRTDEGRKTPRFDYADAETGRIYGRAAHIRSEKLVRVPRSSKYRFVYRLGHRKQHKPGQTPEGQLEMWKVVAA